MAARWLARAARDAAGLCTKAAWHAAVAAADSSVGGASAAAFAFAESAAPLPAVPEPSSPPPLGPLGVAPGSGAALSCPLLAPPPLTW
jgi:hypothetical protein